MAFDYYSGTTPDDVKRRKTYAQHLLEQGSSAAPIQHPLGILARTLQGGMGGYIQHQADQESKDEQAKAMAGILSALGGQSGGAPVSPTALPQPTQVMPGRSPPVMSPGPTGGPTMPPGPETTRGVIQGNLSDEPMTGMSVNGQPVQLAQNAPQVPQRAPSMPAAQGGLPPGTAGTIAALANPWLPPGMQALGATVLGKQLTPKDQWTQYQSPDGTMLQRNLATGEVKAAGTENQAISDVEYARKNWQQLGFPDPTSKDKAATDFWQSYSAKRLGGPGVNVSMNTEKTGQEAMAKEAVKAYTDAQFASRESQKRVGIYDRMDKAAEAFKPGASAELRLGAQRWLKELGIAQPNVPEGEILKMLGQQLAIHAQPKGQGAVSNFERDMFAKSLPNMTQSPEGFKAAVGISRSLEKFDMQVAQIYRDSARMNNGIPNYLDVQDRVAQLGSPLDDNQIRSLKNYEGQALGNSGGAVPTGKVRRYNPETGNIE